MGILSFLKRKSSRTYSRVINQGLKQAVWTPKDYSKLAEAGYINCMTAYACVRLISSTAAGLEWKLSKMPRDKRGKVEGQEASHPLLQLLARPNPRQSGSKFMEAWAGFLLLAGNDYILKLGPTSGTNRGIPKELVLLYPDLVRIVPGTREDPIKEYEYRVDISNPDKYEPELINHTKLFHPTDQFYGLSPLQVASRGIDIVNMATEWNFRLLQNDGRLPGAWILKDGQLDDEEARNLEKELDEKFAGYSTIGRAPLLQGELEWKDYGLAPRDIEHLNTDKYNSRKICAVYNIAPELIGDSESKTYSNYQEARKALYVETVLPLMRIFRDELNHWLTPLYGDRLYLDIDRDKIEPLKEDRKSLYEYVDKASWLSDNEKRELTGFEGYTGGDVIWKPINLVPVTASAGSKSVPLFKVKSRTTKSFWTAPERKRLFWDSFVSRIEAKEKPIASLAEEFLTTQAKAVKAAASKLTSLSGVEASSLLDLEKQTAAYLKKTLAWYVETFQTAGEAGVTVSKGQLYMLEKKDFDLFDLTPELEEALRKLIVESGTKINTFTMELIRDTLKLADADGWTVEEFTQEIWTKLDSFNPARARRIARTEAAKVENWGQDEGYRQTEFIEARYWLSAFTDTTRETHAAAGTELAEIKQLACRAVGN